MESDSHHTRGGPLAGTRSLVGLVSDIGGAVAAASMLAAVTTGVAGAVVVVASDRFGALLSVALLATGAVLGATGMWMFLAHRSSSIESQNGYRWIEATYTYRIDAGDPQLHTQRTDVVIKAIRGGIRTFSNKYRWSGSGEEPTPIVRSTGHTIVGDVEDQQGWQRYDVRLEPSLRRGERTTVSIEQTFRDTDERFEPFLGKTLYQPTKRLRLRVELPMALMPSRAWGETYVRTGPEDQLIHRSTIVPSMRGGRACLEWTPRRLKLGRSYRVRWRYEPGGSLYEAHRRTLPDEGSGAERPAPSDQRS